MEINPLLRGAVCSATGAEVDTQGFTRPLGLAPQSQKPIELRYEAGAVKRRLDGGFANSARPGLARYEALLPVVDLPDAYVGDVGRTFTCRNDALSKQLGLDIHIKNEGQNPSGSFKDRGLSIGVALGVVSGAQCFCLPTQGNAGVAAALFSARLGLPAARVTMPEGYQGSVYHRACELFGGQVSFFGENIAAAGGEMRRRLADELGRGEIVDLSTFFEPGRLEGKKTMGLEIWEHFGADDLPEWIFYPTGGGTGLVGIWKAFEELTQLGLLDPNRQRLPKMVAVQSEQCAPVVRSFERGLAEVEPVTSAGTMADGLDVPKAIMGHRMLQVLRESQGTAVAVSEAAIERAFHEQGRLGLSAGAECAALLAAVTELRAAGTLASGSRVLLLYTSGPFAALARSAPLR